MLLTNYKNEKPFKSLQIKKTCKIFLHKNMNKFIFNYTFDLFPIVRGSV